MLLAIPLMLIGVLVLVTAVQWRMGNWLESARWVLRWLSPHVLAGTAAAGVMIFGLGLMLIWPPAFLLSFGAAVYWLWTMARSAQRGATGRVPEAPEAAANIEASPPPTPEGAIPRRRIPEPTRTWPASRSAGTPPRRRAG
jgi:hypothetical protein